MYTCYIIYYHILHDLLLTSDFRKGLLCPETKSEPVTSDLQVWLCADEKVSDGQLVAMKAPWTGHDGP